VAATSHAAILARSGVVTTARDDRRLPRSGDRRAECHPGDMEMTCRRTWAHVKPARIIVRDTTQVYLVSMPGRNADDLC